MIIDNNRSRHSIMTYSIDDVEDLKNYLKAIFMGYGQVPIFMCVGVDSVVVDALGPIVAEILKSRYEVPTYVYGGLEYNITASNVQYAYHMIEIMHSGSPIFIIDASISQDSMVGDIKVIEDSVVPGGLTIDYPKAMGDGAILGVVGVGGIKDKVYLSSTRLKVVLDMAEAISYAVATAIGEMDIENNVEYRYI